MTEPGHESGDDMTADSLGCVTDGIAAVQRDVGQVRSLVGALSQKYAKFNTRAWHMSHDLAGMRMDLSDMADDIANVSDAAEMINLRTMKIETELTAVRNDVARLTTIVEKLAAQLG